MNGYGYPRSAAAADPWTSQNNTSTMSKMEHTFWVTKQSVFRKLGKKEDECIVASDAELDAKLELFRSVQDTCSDLQRILDKYQERLCNLAQEESAMGRFLKECSKRDQTNAGKAMVSVGRALSYSGQQRLALRVPLQRLHQEVETFRQRAIEDTLLNVTAMERQRTEYRAALSWMKNISQELDPDTHKQLDKFRKVQGQVRQSKSNFDRLKLDCLQKVDLLAAARCNMFSHALTLYQQALIQHARRAHRAFGTVAKDLKGYQHFEFSVVPELTEESSRLANQTKNTDDLSREDGKTEKDGSEEGKSAGDKHKSDSLQNLLSSAGELGALPLIPLDLSDIGGTSDLNEMSDVDLLATENTQELKDILGSVFPDATAADLSLPEDWESLFQSTTSDESVDSYKLPKSFPTDEPCLSSSEELLPSQLLDNFVSTLKLGMPLESLSALENNQSVSAKSTSWNPTSQSDLGFMSSFMANLKHGPLIQPTATAGFSNTTQSPKSSPIQVQGKIGTTSKKDMSAWYDLFADLDPLANPDAIDSKSQEEERNC